VAFKVGEEARAYDHCLVVKPGPQGGHPDAALPAGFLPALYCNLHAAVNPPALQADPAQLLAFHCLASDSRRHSSRTRTVTLSNDTPSMLNFSLRTSGAFEVDALAQELPHQRIDDAPTSSSDGSPDDGRKSPRALSALRRPVTLKPTQSISVNVVFTQEPEEKAPRHGDEHQYEGALTMHFDNGSVQEYVLQGTILYSSAVLSVPDIDFGIVRVGADASSEITLTATTLASSQWSLVTAGATLGAPPRRGSVSMGRRRSVTGVAIRRSSLTADMMAMNDPFVFNVQSGFFDAEVEFRFVVKGGEIVSRRRQWNVGGWLASLSTEEAHEFYDLAAGRALVPRAPWGQHILNWVYQFGSDSIIEEIKGSMQGADTFTCIFLGEDLAEWFELRKEAKVAGAVRGRPLFLKDPPSEVKLRVVFTPEGDETYHKRYDIRMEHGRCYTFDVRGQGTSDEELID